MTESFLSWSWKRADVELRSFAMDELLSEPRDFCSYRHLMRDLIWEAHCNHGMTFKEINLKLWEENQLVYEALCKEALPLLRPRQIFEDTDREGYDTVCGAIKKKKDQLHLKKHKMNMTRALGAIKRGRVVRYSFSQIGPKSRCTHVVEHCLTWNESQLRWIRQPPRIVGSFVNL